jgi:FtsH-binding integral membrane protein
VVAADGHRAGPGPGVGGREPGGQDPGAYAGIDFSFLGSTLFAGLTLVLLGGLYRLLFSISDGWRRLLALFGCAVFVGYLVFDFNRLTRSPRNDWEKALDLAISLYLDIINLFLQLLDLLHR